MKLTDFFTSDKQITEQPKSQTYSVKNDVVSRQIRSLIPGQTLQGEVVSKIGNEVQIRIGEDVVLMAKLEQAMNLDIGKLMTFEVKNNGKALLLSPLFTNMATDANIMKALDMASLPVNETTVSVAKNLMEAGLPIDRNTLQQVFREVNQFPNSEVLDIVNLHKLELPVTETNVTQMASYRNLSHQILGGLNHMMDSMPDVFAQMMDNGNTEGTVILYQQLVLMSGQNFGTENAITGQTVMGNSAIRDNAVSGETVIQIPGEAITTGTLEGEVAKAVISEQEISLPVNAEGAVEQETENINSQTQSRQKTSLSAPFTELLNSVTQGNDSTQVLEKLGHLWKQSGGDKEFIKPLLEQLKSQFLLTPEEVSEPGKIEELYDKLEKQLRGLAQTLESLGQTSSGTYKAVTNMTQNLDFMQQMNQMYAYVQLPLRLQNSEAHGDLYVYSNKKHLASPDGEITALLHLDMEHLGPVDVHVSLKQNDVKTKFYLADDELLDFLMGHIDILTERLQKRGYSCECTLQVREQGTEKESNGSIQKLLQQEHHVPLAEYAFDVRT